MTWRVELSERAARDLRNLDNVVSRRILDALSRLVETGLGDVRQLRGARREFRRCVGQWRVRFIYDYQARVILALRILPRGAAYRQ